MRRFFHRVLLSLVALVASSVIAAEPERILLAVGEQRTLRLGDVDRTSVGNPSVASASPEGSGAIRVKGSAPGTTEIRVWTGTTVRTLTVVVK